jgi:hypothetical protein
MREIIKIHLHIFYETIYFHRLESMSHTFPYGWVVFKPSCSMAFKDITFVEAPESNMQLFNQRPFTPNER